MPLEVREFLHRPTSTWSYVAWDTASGTAAIVDPALDFDPASGRIGAGFAESVTRFVREQGLEPRWILETHAHADHLTAAAFLKRAFPAAEVAIGRGIATVQTHFGQVFNLEPEFATDGSQFDRLLDEHDLLPLGELEIAVLATPGHTPDSLAYLVDDAAFVGDSIFMPDSGTARCDFPGGDAKTLYRSIQKLFSLPEHTRLFLCHDYAPGGREYLNTTTVAEEKANNIHVGGGRSEAEFVKIRAERDAALPPPRLLYPALQVNLRAGELPPAESNGVRYLKIPLQED